MIDTPHENRQQRLISTKQLNLLSFDTNVFFLQLAESAYHTTHSYSKLSRFKYENKSLSLRNDGKLI